MQRVGVSTGSMTMAHRLVAMAVGAALLGAHGNMIDIILPEMVPPANCPHGCMEVREFC
jgi:hypothetical protein